MTLTEIKLEYEDFKLCQYLGSRFLPNIFSRFTLARIALAVGERMARPNQMFSISKQVTACTLLTVIGHYCALDLLEVY